MEDAATGGDLYMHELPVNRPLKKKRDHENDRWKKPSARICV